MISVSAVKVANIINLLYSSIDWGRESLVDNTFPVEFIKPGMILDLIKAIGSKSYFRILSKKLINKILEGITNLDIL